MKRIYFTIGLVLICCNLCFAQPANKPRYISLAPSTTEILFALGLDEEIVGVSSYCNYPAGVATKQKVGTFSQPNIEKIISLKPDHIFCTGLEQTPIVEELRRLGFKVYVAYPSDMRELLGFILDIGQITGRIEEAKNLVKVMRSKTETIASKVKLIPEEKRMRVFIEIWDDPLTTAGVGSFVDNLLSISGGINIAYNTKRAYSIFSPEEVIKRNPDCIIITYMNKQELKHTISNRFGWSGVSAVKHNRVYADIDPDLLLRPGPRAVRGIEEIYVRLYH